MAEVLANHHGRGRLIAWSEQASGGSTGDMARRTAAALVTAGVPPSIVRRNPAPRPARVDDAIAIDAPGSDANHRDVLARYFGTGARVARWEIEDPFLRGDAATYAAALVALETLIRRDLLPGVAP